jgi:hypothetical protein
MVKKNSPSYAAVELEPIDAPLPPTLPVTATEQGRRGRPAANQTLREASKPVMLYLNPAGLKALKRYALDQNTKVHSLLLEAVEDWFRSHGLRESVRVSTGQEQEPARKL